MWASNFEYAVQKDLNGDLKNYSISGPRLSFSLDDSESSPHDYFGVPVSSDFVRILQPEHRPAVKSVAPVGYVTTVELSPDHEDEAQVIDSFERAAQSASLAAIGPVVARAEM